MAGPFLEVRVDEAAHRAKIAEEKAQIKQATADLTEAVSAPETDPSLVKSAADTMSKFTRRRMREDGIYRRILPMEPAPTLDRAVDHDLPVVICEFESDVPAAMTIPFATLARKKYLRGQKYLVSFARMTTPEMVKDVVQLRTWISDLRQIASDNMIRDLLAEEDRQWLQTCNTVMIGPDVECHTSGVAQWRQFSSAVTRDSVAEMLKILPSTPSSLETQKILVNNITVYDLAKLDRIEMGGDLAQDVFQRGWAERKLMGKDLIVTIKKALVPTRTFYMFADPDYCGKSYSLEETTMFIERKKYFITFSAWQAIGGAIGNVNSVARCDMDG